MFVGDSVRAHAQIGRLRAIILKIKYRHGKGETISSLVRDGLRIANHTPRTLFLSQGNNMLPLKQSVALIIAFINEVRKCRINVLADMS